MRVKPSSILKVLTKCKKKFMFILFVLSTRSPLDRLKKNNYCLRDWRSQGGACTLHVAPWIHHWFDACSRSYDLTLIFSHERLWLQKWLRKVSKGSHAPHSSTGEIFFEILLIFKNEMLHISVKRKLDGGN